MSQPSTPGRQTSHPNQLYLDDTLRWFLIIVGIIILSIGSILAFTGVLVFGGLLLMAIGIVLTARGFV